MEDLGSNGKVICVMPSNVSVNFRAYAAKIVVENELRSVKPVGRSQTIPRRTRCGIIG